MITIDLWPKIAANTGLPLMILGEGCQISGKWREIADEWNISGR
jgi:hypothetical protein